MELKSKEELVYTVQSNDLAKALFVDNADDFPEVLATSRMIALMELAAARLMRPLLSSDELSVGVDVSISHLAATPNGAEVRVTAIFTGMQGRLYAFDVEVHDGAGLAGKGTHTRAVVETKRLIQGALNRTKKSQP